MSIRGYHVVNNDLYVRPGFRGVGTLSKDYLTAHFAQEYIITNPPFSLWDEFVLKAKSHCKKFMFIGRLNYFGTFGRYEKGLWDNLKWILPFNRYIDYRTPYREDALFHVGSQATAWFLWDIEYEGYPMTQVLDVQKYAKLGAYKEKTLGVPNE